MSYLIINPFFKSGIWYVPFMHFQGFAKLIKFNLVVTLRNFLKNYLWTAVAKSMRVLNGYRNSWSHWLTYKLGLKE